MTDQRLARWRQEVRRVIPAADAELVEEIAQHAQDRWTSARAAGMDLTDCDAHALQEIGGWRDVSIPARRPRWTPSSLWTGFGHDLRYSARALRVHPVFTTGAALLTAIALAAGVVAFAVIEGILRRPLPYPADRLVVLWQVRQGEQGQVSYPDFADVAGASVFDAAAAMGRGRGSLRIGEAIERVNMIEMESRGYSMLGARPALGRLLDRNDSCKNGDPPGPGCGTDAAPPPDPD